MATDEAAALLSALPHPDGVVEITEQIRGQVGVLAGEGPTCYMLRFTRVRHAPGLCRAHG